MGILLMVYILGTIQLLLIIYICFFEYKNKSSVLFLWVTLFIMFGMMHFVTPFLGSNFSNSVLNEASIFVIGFCFLYIITRKLFCLDKKKKHYEVFSSTNQKRKKHNFLTALLVLICAYMIIVVAKSQGGLMNSSWSGGRDYLMSKSYVSSDNMFGILYFALGGIPLICIINKEYKNFLICFISQFLVLFFTRNRVLMLPTVVSIIAFVIFKLKSKISLKVVVLALFGGFFVVYFVYAIRAFRWLGSLSDAASIFSFSVINERVLEFIKTDNGELGLRNVFYTFIDNNNNYSGFNEMATYIRMLFVYIPTKFSFGLKPSDFAETMALALGGSEGGSMHPTLFGDCYANGGFLAFFLGILWGIIANIIDYVIGRIKHFDVKRLLYVLSACSFIVIGRGAVYNGFVNIAWGFLFLLIIYYLFLKNKDIHSYKLGGSYETCYSRSIL